MSEQLLFQTFHAREAYLRQLGRVDDFLLSPLTNPTFMGGPRWPSLRQSWRTVRNGAATIIVSDGLSDSFDDEVEPNTGFGIEVLGETRDALPEQLQTSWLFSLVYQVSQQAASMGRIREWIDEMGLLSMEIDAPANDLHSLSNAEGKIGILLGLHPPRLPVDWHLPSGLVRVVTIKLLLPEELAYVTEHYEAGRERLRELFTADESYHLSSLNRASVI